MISPSSSLADPLQIQAAPETLGARLRRLRRATGCTVAEIAAAAGFNRELLRSFERDKEEPSNGALKRLARVYGVSLDDLVTPPPPAAPVRGGDRSER